MIITSGVAPQLRRYMIRAVEDRLNAKTKKGQEIAVSEAWAYARALKLFLNSPANDDDGGIAPQDVGISRDSVNPRALAWLIEHLGPHEAKDLGFSE